MYLIDLAIAASALCNCVRQWPNYSPIPTALTGASDRALVAHNPRIAISFLYCKTIDSTFCFFGRGFRSPFTERHVRDAKEGLRRAPDPRRLAFGGRDAA